MGRVIEARSRLVAQRDETVDRLAALNRDFAAVVASSQDSNADDEHDPEGATIAFERSQIGAIVQQTRRHLVEIDAALARVEAGSYGICEECGEPIAEARLKVRPIARTCIRCATAGSRRT